MRYLLVFWSVCVCVLYKTYSSLTITSHDANSMIKTIWLLMAVTGIGAALRWFFGLFTDDRGNGNP